jgi:hypothetical protein
MKHPNISFLGFKEDMLSVAIHSFKKTKLKHFIGFEAMCPSIKSQSTFLWQGCIHFQWSLSFNYVMI